MKELIGRTVSEVWVGPGEGTIYFKTDAGWLSWHAVGDCCSESWFADILGIEDLLNGRVSTVAEKDLPDDDQYRTRQEIDCVYGYAVTTEKGAATIAFRCSSNGYYGGYLSAVDEDVEPPATARQIVSDWSA
jgi:hypothetical protein